jgi:ABC-2 type transport system ATP-binding protein
MPHPALKIRQLSKIFGKSTAVDNLTLDISQGEIFGLLGPNGAGKSTTINMITGATRIGSGNIEVYGHSIQKDYLLTRRLIGVMHQEIVIDTFFTISRALKIHSGYYGVPDDPKWRETLLERLGLVPHLDKPMNKLSGGLKRRLMIAKALIHKPRLLILDEPTAGVDIELRHSLWDFVREINQNGTTVLLTTHYLEEAEQMCGRIAIMDNGSLVALESKEKLLDRLEGRKLILTLEKLPASFPKDAFGVESPVDIQENQISLCLMENQTPGDILQTLQQMDLRVVDIEIKKPALEDVFLALTGNKPLTRNNNGL